ncbi:hypothetical protein BJ508DRAFT_314280 [Ascobolus immersus RN42]|uniref:C2H2-type domain-containing protein n=1 Tax=Ascobolus immersus RN42 TaxID=1160509 RepID=A0A3N4HFN5_ASCIM|nr:hypothetical protein BJ508DRAFT_314280 [Ascobolus immersus RN42]
MAGAAHVLDDGQEQSEWNVAFIARYFGSAEAFLREIRLHYPVQNPDELAEAEAYMWLIRRLMRESREIQYMGNVSQDDFLRGAYGKWKRASFTLTHHFYHMYQFSIEVASTHNYKTYFVRSCAFGHFDDAVTRRRVEQVIYNFIRPWFVAWIEGEKTVAEAIWPSNPTEFLYDTEDLAVVNILLGMGTPNSLGSTGFAMNQTDPHWAAADTLVAIGTRITDMPLNQNNPQLAAANALMDISTSDPLEGTVGPAPVTVPTPSDAGWIAQWYVESDDTDLEDQDVDPGQPQNYGPTQANVPGSQPANTTITQGQQAAPMAASTGLPTSLIRCQQPSCDKSFQNKHLLVQHMKFHFKPYWCISCEKAFGKKHSYYAHVTAAKDLNHVYHGEVDVERCGGAGKLTKCAKCNIVSVEDSVQAKRCLDH